jgi:hypothetical protein
MTRNVFTRNTSPTSKQERILKALLKRVRRAHEAGEVGATAEEREAVKTLLLPAAIRHAQDNRPRLPQYVVLCGSRVFVKVTLSGQVFVFAERDGVPVVASNPFRV